MEMIVVAVLAIVVIAGVHEIAPRIHIAAPLILVVVGVVVGILPFVPDVEVDPEWILVGVLPPLLYSAAVSMPTMDFRRDIGAIGALSVVLVILSSVILGFFFTWVLPDIGLATGVALGAIVSPTDAVATSIAKRLGVPSRVTAVLEGESMLNDATALVLLRSAVAAAAASVSFWGVAWDLVFAVVAAVVIGAIVGVLNLRVRSLTADATVNTALSFTVPFIAYLPAEHVGASGLVAAVTAGLVTGSGAVRYLTPQHRLSDRQNWHTVELILEGGVFLLMGLELSGLMADVREAHTGIHRAVWIGLAALAVALAVRALYVAPLVWFLDRSARRGSRVRPYLENMHETLSDRAHAVGPADAPPTRRSARRMWLRRRRHGAEWRRQGPDFDPGSVSPDTARHFSWRLTRKIADIDYYRNAPMGPKEGTIIVWAGLRGVVTVAAAQTLPSDTPSRSLLVLIAFTVAAASLIGQGGTLSWLIRRLRLQDTSEESGAEYDRLRGELAIAARKAMAASEVVKRFPWMQARVEKVSRESDDDPSPLAMRREYEVVRREIIGAQRTMLLRLRSEGSYSSALLTRELAQLDAEEISLDMRAAE